MGTLTGPGYFWALLSLAAAILACSGFYLPFWVQGRILGRVDAYFNSFRRCNYPRMVTPQGAVEIVMQCARYSRWRDIPSSWWQASTVLILLGCVMATIVAVMAITACCFDYIIHSATARMACSLQLVAGVLVGSGLIVYPLGWDNKEMRDCCGPSVHMYTLGNCKISWSVFLLVAAIILLFACFALSPCITKVNYCYLRS
ncbi:LHFPL tetraspan subfamily member 6 protein-like [Macrosteles quadrilineatus]|uniref:LHFPL tetraspan subfamily member 6 protein-like n=1 Tax=Macrosteles quadrilineatus TaxID=74068 RepID=UPI0023E2608F|nr:LHFPL tetraspan subfamily member 6 protein-like [Macrosteles quadrilineatus]XP_054264222.1 LHFPL tetraspan subfamily member 6 protein-like [Macrosteles quadrilineatus]